MLFTFRWVLQDGLRYCSQPLLMNLPSIFQRSAVKHALYSYLESGEDEQLANYLWLVEISLQFWELMILGESVDSWACMWLTYKKSPSLMSLTIGSNCHKEASLGSTQVDQSIHTCQRVNHCQSRNRPLKECFPSRPAEGAVRLWTC